MKKILKSLIDKNYRFFFIFAIYLISKYIYLTYSFTQKIFNFQLPINFFMGAILLSNYVIIKIKKKSFR